MVDVRVIVASVLGNRRSHPLFDDFLQEGHMAVMRSGDKNDCYKAQAVRNSVISAMRRENRKPFAWRHRVGVKKAAGVPDDRQDVDSPERAYEEKEALLRIHEVAATREDWRACLEAVLSTDMYQDAATLLGLSTKSSITHRMKKLLAAVRENYGY